MNNFIKLTILFLFLFFAQSTTYPHSCRTDAQSGHTNKKTGECHFHNRPESKTSILPQSNLEVKVLSVADGDTLKIIYNEQKESVRLIGIDTPESRVNKKTKKDAKRSGQDVEVIIAITAYVESLVKPGDTITIEFDVQ